MDDTERARMVRAYELGASIAEIAEKEERAPSTVRTELLAAGVTLRPQGRPSHRAVRLPPGAVHGSTVLPTYGVVPEDVEA